MARLRFAAIVLLAAGALSACGGRAAHAAVPDRGGTVVLDVHYSKFSSTSIDVREGQTVRFVVNNRDPIPHELIVGSQGVQDRHERGTEPHHGERPGEVSVPAGSTAETTVTFTRSGKILFGCHLPGHWDYGMRGTIRVS